MKLRYKPLASMLAGLIAVSVFLTGCSSAELGYLSLNKEMLNLNAFETTSSISINIDKLPSDESGNNNALMQSFINALLTEFSLNLDQRVDYNKDVATGDFYLLNKLTGERQEVVGFICSGDAFYVNVSRLKNTIGLFGGSGDAGSLDRVLGGVTWISYSKQDFEQMMPPGANIRSTPDFNIGRNRRQSILLYQLLDDLSQKAFQQFSSGIAAQEGNTFKISLNAQEASGMIKSLLTYSVNHIDQVGGGLKAFVQGLTEEDLAALRLTDQQRQEMLAGIDQMVAEVSADPEQYLSGLDQNLDASALGNSTFHMTLAKAGSGAYHRTTGLVLDIKPPNDPSGEVSLSLGGDDTIRVIPSFQVDIPTQDLITFTQLQARLPVTMSVNTEYGHYTVCRGLKNDSGKIDSRIVEGHLYLPLRKVGEALDENVGWNTAAKRAFIVHKGRSFDMDGIIINGQTYVKIRDFEKLGFQVDWNPGSRVVTISE